MGALKTSNCPKFFRREAGRRKWGRQIFPIGFTVNGGFRMVKRVRDPPYQPALRGFGVLLRLAPQPPVVTLQTTSQCPCRAHWIPHDEACAGSTLPFGLTRVYAGYHSALRRFGFTGFVSQFRAQIHSIEQNNQSPKLLIATATGAFAETLRKFIEPAV